MVVLEAGCAPGKPPWEISLCLEPPREGRELDLAAARTGLLTALHCGGAFLLPCGLLLMPTGFFSSENYLRNSIKTNKKPKETQIKTTEMAFY